MKPKASIYLPAQMSGGHWLYPDAPNLPGLLSLIPVDIHLILSSAIFEIYFICKVSATYQVFTHVLEGTEYALFLGPFRHDFRIGNYNSHQKRLESAEKWGLILFNNYQQGGAVYVCGFITCRLSPWT